MDSVEQVQASARTELQSYCGTVALELKEELVQAIGYKQGQKTAKGYGKGYMDDVPAVPAKGDGKDRLDNGPAALTEAEVAMRFLGRAP